MILRTFRLLAGILAVTLFHHAQAASHGCGDDAALLFSSEKHVFDVLNPMPPLEGYIDSAVVVIESGSKILLNLRNTEIGYGQWALIGGKSDGGESILQTVQREAFEEVGIHIHSVEPLFSQFHHDQKTGQKFRVFIVKVIAFDGVPEIKEVEKIRAIKWFERTQLPRKLFPTIYEYLHLIGASQR